MAIKEVIYLENFRVCSFFNIKLFRTDPNNLSARCKVQTPNKHSGEKELLWEKKNPCENSKKKDSALEFSTKNTKIGVFQWSGAVFTLELTPCPLILYDVKVFLPVENHENHEVYSSSGALDIHLLLKNKQFDFPFIF